MLVSVIKRLHIRTFSNSVVLSGKDKEWQAIKRQKREKYERRLTKIQNTNPFGTNVGMKHQLALLDLPDPEDPALQNIGNNDITAQFDAQISDSDIFQKRMESNIPYKELIDKDKVRRSIVKKKYFPSPETPSLVTVMEKEMIKKLFKDQNWTIEELSESFAITTFGVRKIVKKGEFLPKDPKLRFEHDKKVQSNWKLLSAGKLDNAETLVDHLERNGQKIFNENRLSAQQRNELLEQLEADKMERKPNLSGEFGQLLLRHQERQREADIKENLEDKSLALDKSNIELEKEYFVPKLLDSVTEHLGPNPYAGTSMINAESNSRLDNNFVTIEKFRKKFYKEMKKKAASADPMAKEYFKWLRQDFKDIKTEELPNVENLQKMLEAPKYEKYANKSKSEPKPQLWQFEDVVEKIEIPKDIHAEGKTYKVDNSYYDSNGDFLHRIPS